MKTKKTLKWWSRFWKRRYKRSFSEWRKKKRSLRKMVMKELCIDFSDERIEKSMAMECFDKYHNIGYME